MSLFTFRTLSCVWAFFFFFFKRMTPRDISRQIRVHSPARGHAAALRAEKACVYSIQDLLSTVSLLHWCNFWSRVFCNLCLSTLGMHQEWKQHRIGYRWWPIDKVPSSLGEVQECTSDSFLYETATRRSSVPSTYVTLSFIVLRAENNEPSFHHKVHMQLTACD